MGPGARIDTSTPSIGRVYDYWLGGSQAFEADRDLAARLEAACPPSRTGTLSLPRELAARDRLFTGRAVSQAVHQGARQVVDISLGFPAAYASPWPGQELRPSHEVASAAAAGARTVYVTRDPAAFPVLAAMLRGRRDVTVVAADPYAPASVLAGPGLAEAVDLSRPVVLVASRVVQFVPADEARRVIAGWMAALTAGSLLALTTGHCAGLALWARLRDCYPGGAVWNHDRHAILAMLDGLDILPPGVQPARAWAPEAVEAPGPLCVLAAMARKA